MNFAYNKAIIEDFPIVSRLVRETHKILLSGVKGCNSSPGEYRKVPVWIGAQGDNGQNATLVPPPANKIDELLKGLEEFINNTTNTPALIKAGLAHVQFETIHPFLDGNGRMGRLLIVLMLLKDRVISEPVLYPSYFFKKFRYDYYNKLQNVRATGDFEGWIKFYLTAVHETALEAIVIAEKIDALKSSNIEKIRAERGQFVAGDLNVLDFIFTAPIVSVNDVADKFGLTYTKSQRVISRFVQMGILQPDTVKERDKVYIFKQYLKILDH
jgi:Fic family protein